MAGVCSKTDNKEIDLPMSCCLGDHPLQEPRLLPCQHSFCKECIKTTVGKEKKKFICPKCQLSILLTENDVHQLPEDVLYQIIQDAKDRLNCVLCKFQGKTKAGSFQCLDCADVLCDQCHMGHTNSSITRLHRVVKVKDIQEGKYKNEIQIEKQMLCDTHNKPHKPKELEYYCQQCKCLVCHMCLNTSHKGHDFKVIDDMNDEKKQTVTNHVTELMELRNLVLEFIALLEQELGQQEKHKELLQNEVHQRAAQFIDIIEKVKEVTLDHIKGHFLDDKTKLESELSAARNKISRIDSVVTYTQAFLDHSNKTQFLQHENKMTQKLLEQKQQKIDRTFDTKVLEIGEPQFAKTEAFITEAFGKITTKSKTLGSTKESRVPCMLIKEPKFAQTEPSMAEAFGNITTKSKTLGTTKERSAPPVLMKEPDVLVREIIGDTDVRSLTVSENEDIVAVIKSTIQVFSSNGKHKETIKCSPIQNPWNVVAKGDHLYVRGCSWCEMYVLIMDFNGNVKKTITLPWMGYSKQGLAVDDEGNVYISYSSKNTIYKCKPNERNAKVFIQQGTHPDLNGPRYLCVTPGGDLIVSNNNSNAIQVYNSQGEFIWQYKGQGDLASSSVYGVCCDKKGYIYIADRDNHRIQVIKDAVSQGYIKIKDFNDPYSITLDKDDNIICGSFGGVMIKAHVWDDY